MAIARKMPIIYRRMTWVEKTEPKRWKFFFNLIVRCVVVYLLWHSQILLITFQLVQLTQSFLLHSDNRSMPVLFEAIRIPNITGSADFSKSNVINWNTHFIWNAWHFCFRHFFQKKIYLICAVASFVIYEPVSMIKVYKAAVLSKLVPLLLGSFPYPPPSLLLCGSPIIRILILNYFGILPVKLCLLNVFAEREGGGREKDERYKKWFQIGKIDQMCRGWLNRDAISYKFDSICLYTDVAHHNPFHRYSELQIPYTKHMRIIRI